jgi:hypothetical protein
VYAVRDCLRPSPIACFSVQQNFWIFNSNGDPILWARNSVELAGVGGIFHGTFLFQIFGQNDRNKPLLCEPEFNFSSTCRSPFYVDYSPVPQSLQFYSQILSNNGQFTVHMSNNFGEVVWGIPRTMGCPCSIETSPRPLQPWGSSPFELVAVGLDNSATATFQNGTEGTIKSILLQSTDGNWHKTDLNAISCAQLSDCMTQLSTQENSLGLKWDVESRRLYWSNSSTDQGVYVKAINESNASPPVPPQPRNENYLYVSFNSALAYLSVYDQLQRISGIDPQTGKPTEMIPNSSLVLDSYIPVKDEPVNVPEEELLMLNPQGAYEFAVAAGGNTAYSIFLSLTTNTDKILATKYLAGSLVIGDLMRFEVESSDLNLVSRPTAFPGMLSIVGIVTVLSGLIFVILALLTLRRKRMRQRSGRRDFDEIQ